MLVKSISFPTSLEDIPDNDFIDVFVKLEDGLKDTYTYTVTVATAKTLESIMDEEKLNYFRIGYPFIIVKKLTKDIIEETVKAYAEYNNGYWLKLYHFADEINETVFNKLQAEHTEYLKELHEYLEELNELEILQFLKNNVISQDVPLPKKTIPKKELDELDNS